MYIYFEFMKYIILLKIKVLISDVSFFEKWHFSRICSNCKRFNRMRYNYYCMISN